MQAGFAANDGKLTLEISASEAHSPGFSAWLESHSQKLPHFVFP